MCFVIVIGIKVSGSGGGGVDDSIFVFKSIFMLPIFALYEGLVANKQIITLLYLSLSFPI